MCLKSRFSRGVTDKPVHECAAIGSNCGFMTSRDVVHYEEAPLGFFGTVGVHHPCGIHVRLKTSTVAVLFCKWVLRDELDYILDLDEGRLDHMMNGTDFWRTWSFIDDWAFLRDIPELRTVYVARDHSWIIYERCTSLEDHESVSDFIIGRSSGDDELTHLIDQYDDNRLGEILCLWKHRSTCPGPTIQPVTCSATPSSA